ncbi:sulfotransferase [Phycisphaerales bacterium AB-hyl4]|uniref:Sulfotransferase n=1 Tax=Natronomicrosphaera hydrolytica TaxID=3242702 RepID=A0ABV4U986_9BACT
MPTPPYILILGHGRSGTNWLLSLLDHSPRTHCRNEPNELGGEPWQRLPSPWVCQPLDHDAVAPHWDAAVAWSAARVGQRDHRLPDTKAHVHQWARPLGLDRMMKGPKLRRAVSVAQPTLAEPEWQPPRWWARPDALTAAVPVLKLNQVPAWACWSLAHRPDAMHVHIVRHPGGFLNSYRNRWLAHHDRDTVTRLNRDRLHQIAAVDDTWATRFDDIHTLTAEAAELWFWRYAAEMIHRLGESRPNYHLLIYEHLAADPVTQTRRLYDACRLDFTPAIERAVQPTASPAIARAWRNKLTAEDQHLIDTILTDSPLNTFWPPQ